MPRGCCPNATAIGMDPVRSFMDELQETWVSASFEEVRSDALVLTARSGGMSRDCTGVSSITTSTGGLAEPVT